MIRYLTKYLNNGKIGISRIYIGGQSGYALWMHPYLAKRFERTWEDTLLFMGWEFKKIPMIRAFILWLITYALIYQYQADIFGKKLNDFFIPVFGIGIVFALALIVNFFAVPFKIFNEQEAKIKALEVIERTQSWNNAMADMLSAFQDKGKKIAEEFSSAHMGNYGDLIKQKDAWLADLIAKMKDEGLPGAYITSVTVQAVPDKPANELASSLIHLHNLIVHLRG